jgi:hypothetical protein
MKTILMGITGDPERVDQVLSAIIDAAKREGVTAEEVTPVPFELPPEMQGGIGGPFSQHMADPITGVIPEVVAAFRRFNSRERRQAEFWAKFACAAIMHGEPAFATKADYALEEFERRFPTVVAGTAAPAPQPHPADDAPPRTEPVTTAAVETKPELSKCPGCAHPTTGEQACPGCGHQFSS